MKPEVRRPFIAGNWKLHKTLEESKALMRDIHAHLPPGIRAEIAVAPVFTALASVRDVLLGIERTGIALAAQDMYWEPQGAFTGAVGPMHLKDVGVQYVIVGHSERRMLFHEDDVTVARKALAALAQGMRPIVCVGETLAEREDGRANAVVVGQTRAALEDISPPDIGRVVIAYEPVWAIGTGKNAQPSDAQEMHASIRAVVGEQFGATVADGMRILYGGSVKADNATQLLAQPDVDGALVGGASLAAASFCAIVSAVG